MRRLLAVIAGLVVLVVGGVLSTDGLQRNAVQGALAEELRVSVPLAGTPRVLVDGYPFAWYAARGSFPAVAVVADGMPMDLGDIPVQFADVDFVLEGVRRREGTVSADSLVGGATLGWVDASALLGASASFDSPGRVAVRVPYAPDVMLPPVEALVTGVPVLDAAARAVSLQDAEVWVAGLPVAPETSGQLLQSLVKPLPLDLAHGLTVARVTVTEDGLALQLSGTDVTFPAR